MPLPFHVSLVDRKDLSGEIYRQIRRAILDGHLRSGDQLPPVRELALSLSVSRMTVTVAYERLAGEGFVSSRVGAGTFVSDALIHGLKPAGVSPISVLQPRACWKSIPLPTAFDDPAQFDFRTGLPDLSLFPHRAWRRLLGRASRTATNKYKHPAGDIGLRVAIAQHIGISRSIRTSPNDILVASGTQQVLDVVARTLLSPGDQIALEDPGYEPARQLFKSLGLDVLGVPVDREGIVVETLTPRTKAVYVTPSHQYPLGMPMALRRRQELLAWATHNAAAIIEDDYDSEFRFGGRPVEPLHTLDTAGCVIYVGSFSKTLQPDLRLAFLVAPPALVPALHRAKYVTDWYTPTATQIALAEFIQAGEFARHIRKVGAAYKERHLILTDAIDRDFRGILERIPSHTGLHIAAFTPGRSAEQVADICIRAHQADVAVQHMSSFAVGTSVRAGLVLGYGAIAAGQIKEGLRRLKTCF